MSGQFSSYIDRSAKVDSTPMPRVRKLSEETRWDMVEYLDQCLRFPAVVPMIPREGWCAEVPAMLRVWPTTGTSGG